jgi:hypothetical protein
VRSPCSDGFLSFGCRQPHRESCGRDHGVVTAPDSSRYPTGLQPARRGVPVPVACYRHLALPASSAQMHLDVELPRRTLVTHKTKNQRRVISSRGSYFTRPRRSARRRGSDRATASFNRIAWTRGFELQSEKSVCRSSIRRELANLLEDR